MNNFDDELRKKFKESFKSIELSEESKKKIKDEIINKNISLSRFERVKMFLNKEIEIDFKVIAACAIFVIIIPTVFSIKGIDELPKEVRITENGMK